MDDFFQLAARHRWNLDHYYCAFGKRSRTNIAFLMQLGNKNFCLALFLITSMSGHDLYIPLKNFHHIFWLSSSHIKARVMKIDL